MNKITVYDGANFAGDRGDFTSDVANLADHNFNNRISSLKVIGNPWVAYSDHNFSAIVAVYEEGEYASLDKDNTISSLQLVTGDLSDPRITLYKNENDHLYQPVPLKPGKPRATAVLDWKAGDIGVKYQGQPQSEENTSDKKRPLEAHFSVFQLSEKFTFYDTADIATGTKIFLDLSDLKQGYGIGPLQESFILEKGGNTERSIKTTEKVSAPVPARSKTKKRKRLQTQYSIQYSIYLDMLHPEIKTEAI